MSHAMRVAQTRCQGRETFAAMIPKLLEMSVWFQVMPLPDDWWALEVKDEGWTIRELRLEIERQRAARKWRPIERRVVVVERRAGA